jgi:cobalt-zinc-cadmium efflux system membrane fusion protein
MSTTTLSALPRTPRGWFSAGAVLLALGTGGALLLRGGSPASAPAAAAQPERATPWLEGGVIRYAPGFAERARLAFTPARSTTLVPRLSVTGEVAWDGRHVAAVGARIEGRLSTLHVVEGQRVKKGEVLATLESGELGRAQAEVLKLRSREQVARLDSERERRLADAKVSAERDAQFAASHAEALGAERVAAEKAVEALGGSTSGPLGILTLRSPLAGRVVELKARRGQTVSPTDTLMVVADPAQVWALLSVFERDLPAVREGDPVELVLPAAPSRTYPGTVAHVGHALDPARRAATVRVELDNSRGELRPGQSLSGVIHASGPRSTQLVVPKAAVTRVDGQPTVFVRTGLNAVTPRTVVLGPEDADGIAVMEGLKEGEEVASAGVLALKAEVFR